MHSEVDGAKAMPLRLPVDEDDYLMPSPGPLGQATGPYMDLIGNTSMAGEFEVQNLNLIIQGVMRNFLQVFGKFGFNLVIVYSLLHDSSPLYFFCWNSFP